MAVLVDRHNDEKYRSRRPVPNDFNYFLPKKKNYCFSILLLLNKIELKEKSGHVVVSLIQFFLRIVFCIFFFLTKNFHGGVWPRCGQSATVGTLTPPNDREKKSIAQ